MADVIPASRSVANAGLTTGIIGSALGVLNGAGGLLGMTGGFGNVEDRHITRHEMDLIREIQNKDMAIAIKESESYTDQKLVDVYSTLAKQDKDINAKIESNAREQAQINATQAVYNGTNAATLNCMQNSINQLMSLTSLKVNADNVCPKPMPQYNSWTAPTTT